MSRFNLVSPEEIARLIAQGQPVVVHEGYALNLGEWLDKHPGGRLAILHMVGRDATDEINIYHTSKALLMMKQYRFGRVQLPWANMDPPIRSPDYYINLEMRKKAKAMAVGGDRRSKKSIDLGSAAAVIGKKLSSTGTCVCRTTGSPCVGVEKLPLSENDPLSTAQEKIRNRERHAIDLEKKEVEQGLKENPLAQDVETQQAILLDYRALHEQIKQEGLYQCRYSCYARESVRYGLLFAAFIGLLYIKWYLTSAIFLGLFWQQIMFTAHDAGHRGISGNFVIDTLIGAFIADFCCGLSIGWWKSSHNVHHLVTNMPEHDPDLQNIPLFTTTPTYMKSILSSFYNYQFVWDAAADYMIPYQKYAYYPVMAFARFNLYMLSWMHLCSPRAVQLGAAWWTRHVELVFMACYWYLFGYQLIWLYLPNWPVRVGFVIVSHLVTMLLHVQITLSHWGMPTSDLGPVESFPARQLRMTMDVQCPAWLDWVHGGLQFQAVHHLFPRVPRHNLRRGQELVREFCEKTGLRYHCYGFQKGNQIVMSRLEEVSQMVTMMVECQKSMAETGESGLH
ncbi:fatty acid desaturas-like protein [Setomelanomma holmii]|uniref:Delta 8-(E)-sphingolipid desaturase n=1 Tax=Setomelanomma holmii TaxID=210430 RepID=A0A9P4HB31_9PLEO|nr:fatty acid desaturas-like protein [Setomelanomma holmii]